MDSLTKVAALRLLQAIELREFKYDQLDRDALAEVIGKNFLSIVDIHDCIDRLEKIARGQAHSILVGVQDTAASVTQRAAVWEKISKTAADLRNQLGDLEAFDSVDIAVPFDENYPANILLGSDWHIVSDLLLKLDLDAEDLAKTEYDGWKNRNSGRKPDREMFVERLFSTVLAGDRIGESASGPAVQLLRACWNPMRRHLLQLPENPREKIFGFDADSGREAIKIWNKGFMGKPNPYFSP